MQRVLTVTLGPRLPQGKVLDFPLQTWKGIATSAGVDLEDFSKPADAAARDGAVKRGPGRPRKEG